MFQNNIKNSKAVVPNLGYVINLNHKSLLCDIKQYVTFKKLSGGTQVFIFMFGGIFKELTLLVINFSKTQINAMKRISKLAEILYLPEVSVRWARMRSGSCLQYDQLKK